MRTLFEFRLLNIFALIYLISMISAFPSSINENTDCSNYCQNDGICVIINNDRQCYCLPEWEGNICQNPREYRTIQIDRTQQMLMSSARNHPCSSIPPNFCNGGLCQFSNNAFSCACPYDRTGSRCERASPCNGFCMNGGTCVLDAASGEPGCQCPPLYTGMRCDAPLTTTADPTATTTTTTTTSTTPNVVCAALQPFCNGGTCIFENNQARCQCPSGKAGEYCEIDTGVTSGPGTANPGTGNPATNNPATGNPGVTNPATGNPGVTNPSSGTDNACASNPCLNNRPCYNNGNTFYCFCGNSYLGSRCETSRG